MNKPAKHLSVIHGSSYFKVGRPAYGDVMAGKIDGKTALQNSILAPEADLPQTSAAREPRYKLPQPQNGARAGEMALLGVYGSYSFINYKLHSSQ